MVQKTRTNLVFWVVNHWGLPLAIHLIIPIVRLLGIRVRNVFWLVPVFWLLVIRIVNFLTLIPVIRLLSLWIL